MNDISVADEVMLTERSRVVEVIVESDRNLVASSDTDGVVTRVELIAPDIVGGHIADEAVVLPVLGLANSSPCGSIINDGDVV